MTQGLSTYQKQRLQEIALLRDQALAFYEVGQEDKIPNHFYRLQLKTHRQGWHRNNGGVKIIAVADFPFTNVCPACEKEQQA